MRNIRRVGVMGRTAVVLVTVGLFALTGCGRQGYVPASLKEHPLTAGPDQVPVKGNPAPRQAEPSTEPSSEPSEPPDGGGGSNGGARKIVVQCMTLEIPIPEDWQARKDGSATVFTVPPNIGGGTLRVAGEYLDGARHIGDLDKLTDELRAGDDDAATKRLDDGVIQATSKTEGSSKIRLGKTADEQTEIVTLNYIYSGGGDPTAMLALQESFAKSAKFTNIGSCQSD